MKKYILSGSYVIKEQFNTAGVEQLHYSNNILLRHKQFITVTVSLNVSTILLLLLLLLL